MDIEYKEVIDFSLLKECINKSRTKIKYVAEDVGISQSQFSQIVKGLTIPMSETVAKICASLKVPLSDILEFKGLRENRLFIWEKPLYERPDKPVGELTYEPLWNLLEDYLKDRPDKSVNDFFNCIEPYRRRNGLSNGITAAWEKRGITESVNSSKRDRKEKGLPVVTRTKLRNNRSVSLRTIYDICNFLGCQPDFVMSYK